MLVFFGVFFSYFPPEFPRMTSITALSTRFSRLGGIGGPDVGKLVEDLRLWDLHCAFRAAGSRGEAQIPSPGLRLVAQQVR